MPTLNLSYRNDVLQVQRRLIELGFLKGFFPDGNWGPMSQQALVEFKRQAGLGSGGNSDSTTQRVLFSDQAVQARPAQR
jgi:peptidoglycan hydrolase-like protein with peptidoglycan-binding domain